MLVKEMLLYPKLKHDTVTVSELYHDQDRMDIVIHSAPPPHEVVLFGALHEKVWLWKWWETKYFAEYVNIFHMYAEMSHDDLAEM